MTKEGLLGFFPQLTYKRYSDLIRAYSTIDAAWDATYTDLRSHLPWKEELITQFISWKQTLDITHTESVLDKNNITVLSLSDADYPALLKEINDPPPCLFVRGHLNTSKTALAVVGTRKPSRYGADVANMLVRELVDSGITIVSGLALGIDALVHEAVVVNNGYTIAVLGSGIDSRSIAPQTNLRLAESIIEHDGAIISEYPPGKTATPYTFPRRNRIIAGLSRGTLVIEAGQSSGALITAQCSLDYNRDVFAVPQQIGSSTGIGVNNLLKQGATVVTDVNDILATFPLYQTNTKAVQKQIVTIPTLNDNESKIYSHIASEPKNIDELIRASLLPHPVVSTTLTLLELKGIIKHIGGTLYIRIR